MKKSSYIKNITISKFGVESSSGALIRSDNLIGEAGKLDLLFVIAGGDPFLVSDKRLFNWLKRLAKFGTIVGGVSGGPVILVKAGLMKDRRMTVHWEHAEGLLEIGSDILLERNLYVMDRDRITCAGGTAPLDMMLGVISSRQGSVFAQYVSDWFLHTEIRPSGGAQRSGLVGRVGTNNSTVLASIELMENHLGDPLTLTQLSDLLSVSERQINRVFRNNLGKSTMTYYKDLRTAKARNLLKNSSLKISEIAEATGFSNPSHLTVVFSNRYGCSPSKFRLAN
mgnify:CR=1 FL=1